MKKFILVPLFVAGAIAVTSWFALLASEVALFDMYPDIDQKVVVKAHRLMVHRTLRGAYADVKLTEEKLDEIFRSIVKELSE